MIERNRLRDSWRFCRSYLEPYCYKMSTLRHEYGFRGQVNASDNPLC